MVDWQKTAATLRCPAVADEVTIIVNSDWSAKCTGYEKYSGSRDGSLELVKRSLNLRRTLECKGLDCPTITAYVERLRNEESKPSAPSGGNP